MSAKELLSEVKCRTVDDQLALVRLYKGGTSGIYRWYEPKYEPLHVRNMPVLQLTRKVDLFNPNLVAEEVLRTLQGVPSLLCENTPPTLGYIK